MSGTPPRRLARGWITRTDRQRAAASDLYRAALERGANDFHPLLAGQALRGLRDGQPAVETVAEVAEQAAATLRSLVADL